MATMEVTNRAGGAETIEKPLPPARAAAAASRPVVLSTEDLAALTALATKLDSLIAASPFGQATITLLTNASATGAAVAWPGVAGFWSAEGNWIGGGSVQLQWRRLSSTGWIPIDTLAADGAIPIAHLPAGELRVVVTGTIVSVSSSIQRTG